MTQTPIGSHRSSIGSENLIRSKELYIACFGNYLNDYTAPWFRQMEAAFISHGALPYKAPMTAHVQTVAKVFSKLGLVRALRRKSNKRCIVPIMHTAEFRFFPASYFSEIVPICFDSWPRHWDKLSRMFQRNNVRDAFITSRNVCSEFSQRHPNIRFHWLPEATDLDYWQSTKPLATRAIDVMELGRKYEQYHAAITQPLSMNNHRHLYQPNSTERIFKTNQELPTAYGETKVSICFPKSVTHPDEAIGIETVTQRYFEAMASRTLIVGHCPRELSDLFGYNPIIPADLENAGQQIVEIVRRIGNYQELVDRNFEVMRTRGTWDARTCQVYETLGVQQ